MMRALILTLLLTLLPLGTVAGAATPTPAELDRRFEALLRAIDVVPTRDQMDRAFPDAPERLMKAAREEKRDSYTRGRAITLLSFYPELPATRALLVELASDRSIEVRRLAVYTLARTFGVPGDAALVKLVRRATDDVAVRVRDHAVRALRWIDHEDAGRLLETLAKGHADSTVRALARRTAERRQERLRGRR